MIKFRKSIAAAIAAASIVANVAIVEQASAAPLVSGAIASAQPQSNISEVGWRHHGGGCGWGR